MNSVTIRRKSETGEYRVNYKGGTEATAGRMVLKVNGKRLELVELCALCVSVRVGKRSGGQKSEVK